MVSLRMVYLNDTRAESGKVRVLCVFVNLWLHWRHTCIKISSLETINKPKYLHSQEINNTDGTNEQDKPTKH